MSLIFRIFFLFSLSAALAGPALFAKPVILSIGDSLTFGLGVPHEKAWPALLQDKLRKDGYPEVQVINAGSSGATTAYGISALRFQLKRIQPDLVIYALGANDGLRGLDPAATYKNMATAMDELKAAKIKVLVLGMKAPPNYGSKFPKEFESNFSKLVDTYKLSFVPFFLEGVAGNAALNQADGIHPNEKGYEKVLALVYPRVKELLP